MSNLVDLLRLICALMYLITCILFDEVELYMTESFFIEYFTLITERYVFIYFSAKDELL